MKNSQTLVQWYSICILLPCEVASNHPCISLCFSADEWVKFDDDKVSVVSPEDILRLSGGGDWHIAYVLLYGPRRLEILEEADKEEH